MAIPANACSYVVLMHTAANTFQKNEPILGISVDAQGNELSWPQTRARLDPTLRAFADTIRAGAPHFPPRIQWQLGITETALRQGRAQLVVASDAHDLDTRTNALLDQGKGRSETRATSSDINVACPSAQTTTRCSIPSARPHPESLGRNGLTPRLDRDRVLWFAGVKA